ncbi:Transmembrane amino acid transporter protein [Teratosphaeria destructans]|uniref:Transmembrane amino acid transporter protein n=1 Tax=Teratosphaeria destructans TaxID=418781 RepID=A0A9W7SY88_9PEZI|nr:Transmembrane amino acid transporter protein [Teratosphaeria destructans]
MAVPFAQVGGVDDPRLSEAVDHIGEKNDAVFPAHELNRSDARRMSLIYTDSSIPFEEYHWWANKSREYEQHLKADQGLGNLWQVITGKKPKKEGLAGIVAPASGAAGGDSVAKGAADSEKSTENTPHTWHGKNEPGADRYGITDDEWYNAQRSIRTATWGSIFYLITTDILGPYSVPWAIAQMGYGPGAALYIVFGLLAVYSGLQIWKMFMGLDSTKYPLRNYGDLAMRVYGNGARILVNVLQSFQFFLNVSLLIESNGQGLAQMAKGASGNGYLCFVVAELIFMLAGFILGQIRTLQRLSFLANIAIWLNVIVIIMTMVVTNIYPPNYDAVYTTSAIVKAPIVTSGNWPAGTDLNDRINGLMQGVFSYGGATLFNELLAEMRRPRDFWKGFICAEIFIISVYLTMGMVVYSAQGQFSYNPAYQGIPNSAYHWQTLGNAVSFISGLIAALLYGNIGVKVFYAAVLRDVFHLPPLNEKKGKWLWVAVVPIYWGLAFIIAAAIPQVSNLSAFVGAACILQFTYTFPPILMVGFNSQKDAIRPDEGFDPATGQVIKSDSGFKRFMRGYMVKWHINTFDVLYFLGALTVAGLGIYSSTTGMHETFAKTSITSFSCRNPAG